MSAVSNMFSPASRQMSTRRVASGTCVLPHDAKNSLVPPNVPVPRLSTGTLKPERPSCRNSMSDALRRLVSLMRQGIDGAGRGRDSPAKLDGVDIESEVLCFAQNDDY